MQPSERDYSSPQALGCHCSLGETPSPPAHLPMSVFNDVAIDHLCESLSESQSLVVDTTSSASACSVDELSSVFTTARLVQRVGEGSDDSSINEELYGCLTKILERANEDKDFLVALVSLDGEHARCTLDALQWWHDYDISKSLPSSALRRRALYCLIKLAAMSGELPPSLFLSGVSIGDSRDPTFFGGFADIFHGSYQGSEVAVKRLRLNEDPKRLHRTFCREALVWRQLKHPNVLPFLGIDAETFKSTNYVCMVSPWLTRGSLLQLIRSESFREINRKSLLLQVANGLAYLHTQKIVHGDIHGGNIFIDDAGHARVADFGIAIVGDDTVGRMSSNTNVAGAIRWMAPERLDPTSSNGRPSYYSDAWSFGCLCLLVHTLRQPFHRISSTFAVQLHIVSGNIPDRPRDEECHGHPVSDNLWALMVRCWNHDPLRRVSMNDIVMRMSHDDFGASGSLNVDDCCLQTPGTVGQRNDRDSTYAFNDSDDSAHTTRTAQPVLPEGAILIGDLTTVGKEGVDYSRPSSPTLSVHSSVHSTRTVSFAFHESRYEYRSRTSSSSFRETMRALMKSNTSPTFSSRTTSTRSSDNLAPSGFFSPNDQHPPPRQRPTPIFTSPYTYSAETIPISIVTGVSDDLPSSPRRSRWSMGSFTLRRMSSVKSRFYNSRNAVSTGTVERMPTHELAQSPVELEERPDLFRPAPSAKRRRKRWSMISAITRQPSGDVNRRDKRRSGTATRLKMSSKNRSQPVNDKSLCMIQ